MSLSLRLVGASVLRKGGLVTDDIAFDNGVFADVSGTKEVDVSGYIILPGIVDPHGDAFEKHLAPRRGAMKDIDQGLIAAEAEIAANGITTATLAQFYSWEGGMRGPDFARRVFSGLAQVRPRLGTDIRAQLRFEVSMLDDYHAMKAMLDEFQISYLVFNDHLPHAELASGKTPPGHVGKSLRIGKNPDKHLEYLYSLFHGMAKVPAALDALCADLQGQGVRLGSHDESSLQDRETWRARGVHISEFPETQLVAEAAHMCKEGVILGAPNVVRGGSHKGNVSALDLIAMGLCDALASDYHYPSLRRAVFLLVDAGVLDLQAAWGLVSSGPARVLGLTDRGDLTDGKRADLIVLDQETRDVCATISAGRVSYLTGDLVERFL